MFMKIFKLEYKELILFSFFKKFYKDLVLLHLKETQRRFVSIIKSISMGRQLSTGNFLISFKLNLNNTHKNEATYMFRKTFLIAKKIQSSIRG